MRNGDHFRKSAERLDVMADEPQFHHVRDHYKQMADLYRRMADQADDPRTDLAQKSDSAR